MDGEDIKMKQKTFIADSPEELDTQVNNFGASNPIRFSQVNPIVTQVIESGVAKDKIFFTQTAWYEDDNTGGYTTEKLVPKQTAQTPQQFKEKKEEGAKVWKVCGDCGSFVLFSKYDHCKCGSTNMKDPEPR